MFNSLGVLVESSWIFINVNLKIKFCIRSLRYATRMQYVCITKTLGCDHEI